MSIPKSQHIHHYGDHILSVLVPVYNDAPFLRECFESIAAQTLDAIEVIVVDDGSTDESRTIAQEYVERYPQFKLITHESNRGTMVARKTAIEHATGRYCCFVDADDYLQKAEGLKMIVRNLIQAPVDILQFPVQPFRVINGIKVFKRSPLFKLHPRSLSSGKEILTDCFRQYNHLWTNWDKIYNTTVCKLATKYIPDKHIILGEDRYIYFIIAFFSHSYRAIDFPVIYAYREGLGITATALTLKKCRILIRDTVEVYNLMETFLMKEGNLEDYQVLLTYINLRFVTDMLEWVSYLNESDLRTALALIRSYKPFQAVASQLANLLNSYDSILSDGVNKTTVLSIRASLQNLENGINKL